MKVGRLMASVASIALAVSSPALAGPPAGVPTGPPAGVPMGPPAGVPMGPPAGVPMGPPAGVPMGPPAGVPKGPPQGLTMGRPQGAGPELGAARRDFARSLSQGAANAAPQALENANENSAVLMEQPPQGGGEEAVSAEPSAE